VQASRLRPCGAAVVLPHRYPGWQCNYHPNIVVYYCLSPAITAAVVFSAEPDSHRPVAGRFDLQRIDAARLAVCWAAHRTTTPAPVRYRARNQKMPLAVVIGAIRRFCWRLPRRCPAGGDVCAVAGLLRQKPLDVVSCRGVDLMAPAEAEIVLEVMSILPSRR